MGSQSATVNLISPCTPLSSLPRWPQLWLLPSRFHMFTRRFQLSHIFMKRLQLSLMFILNPLFLLVMLQDLSGQELASTTWVSLFLADSESWVMVQWWIEAEPFHAVGLDRQLAFCLICM